MDFKLPKIKQSYLTQRHSSSPHQKTQLHYSGDDAADCGSKTTGNCRLSKPGSDTAVLVNQSAENNIISKYYCNHFNPAQKNSKQAKYSASNCKVAHQRLPPIQMVTADSVGYQSLKVKTPNLVNAGMSSVTSDASIVNSASGKENSCGTDHSGYRTTAGTDTNRKKNKKRQKRSGVAVNSSVMIVKATAFSRVRISANAEKLQNSKQKEKQESLGQLEDNTSDNNSNGGLSDVNPTSTGTSSQHPKNITVRNKIVIPY